MKVNKYYMDINTFEKIKKRKNCIQFIKGGHMIEGLSVISVDFVAI